MLSWLDRYAGLAFWLLALAGLGLLVCAVTAVVGLRARRRRDDLAALCATNGPVQSLCESARLLRDMVERPDGLSRLTELTFLRDGTLAQRIRDVRTAPVDRLPTPRAIEAAYQSREAAARLTAWLEKLGADPGEARLGIQTIWKALHDAAGNLDRDIAAFERPGVWAQRR